MNIYVFEKTSEAAIRGIWIESDGDGCKSVVDIFEMRYDGTKENLKFIVKCIYEMMFVGEQPADSNGYEVRVAFKQLDDTLQGKARKRSSKEINMVTEQLWTEIGAADGGLRVIRYLPFHHNISLSS
jgi:hypothetical protein